ncbi:MAG: hypothetical protein R3250_06095, partial [Melioribacteraceae bacterium]|nr:hypothetical protein [Melioribacteraceae bacterium]
NRILKFNLTGEYLTEIGGNDAGIFALSNPLDFCIDKQNDIFVLDDSSIKVFDQFGNGKYKIDLDFTPHKIELSHTEIILIEENRIVFYRTSDKKITNEFKDLFNNLEEKIIDAKRIGNYVYVLSSNKIVKYKFK